jgi:hypothetical protein
VVIANPAPPRQNGVIKEPLPGEYAFAGDYVLYYASVADEVPQWGMAPMERDIKLREFWPTEPIFAGALFTTASRYAAFGWQLDGPKRTVNEYERMFQSCERGQGWDTMILKFLIDWFTCDNGGFLEVIRFEDKPESPVATMNHLDSGRCIRTGRKDVPVIYRDRWGRFHDLKWYQVIALAEFPSPIEVMRGIGYCALTRCLRAAQIMRDISIYKHEKVSGRWNRAIWLVSGVTTKSINDVLAQHNAMADSQNLQRYTQPAVLGSLDPNAKVAAEKLELASLPDGFDEEKTFRQYINQLALAFGGDFQDYAPLQGGGLGASAASTTSHVKSRSKGPRLFMSMMEHALNYHGIVPTNLTFKFGDQDIAEDMDNTKLRVMRAEERAMRIKSGELSPEIARQIAVDAGDLDERYLASLAEYDLTPTDSGDGATNDPSGDVQTGKPKTTQNKNTPATVQGATNGA